VAYNDLREWIAALEKAGELKRITAEVDPVLEVAEITDRVSKWGAKNGRGPGGPALLFENVKGHAGHKILINQFGSERRMNLALGSNSLDEIAERIQQMMDVKTPHGLLEKLKMLPMLAELGNVFPKRVTTGPCKEVIKREKFSLLEFPILQCWPQDGGRFITLPCVMTRDPRTGKRNVGMYRMHVYDATSTGMHWQRHKVGSRHYAEYEAQGRDIPVAIVLGGDPALTYAATAPLPDEIDEIVFAGFLRKKAVELVKCKTIDIEVPADAEFVIEGIVPANIRRREGPFGDHTGYYSLADDYPVFNVTAITHRARPVYPATIVGPPPMEDGWLGKATERIFLPLIRMVVPEILDYNLPVEGVFHNLALVKIRKRYPGHARKVMNAIWGLGQMMFTKCIIVVDEDVDILNAAEVVWRTLANIDPQRDIMFVQGPVDVLDHASPYMAYGSKMGIDATLKWPEEGFDREWPEVLSIPDEVKRRIDSLWPRLGL